MRRVPLELTELAVTLVNAAHASFSTLEQPIEVRLAKATTGPLYGPSNQQLRSHAAFLRSVSIVEAYIDTLSSSLFVYHGNSRDQLFQRLAAMAQEQSESSWDNRKENFRTHHGVILGDRLKFSDLDAAFVVRNAIAHGLGALTRRQRNSKDRKKVVQIGVGLSDDRVYISEMALERLRSSSISFINDVDQALPHAPVGL
jgi:hypothetical protein